MRRKNKSRSQCGHHEENIQKIIDHHDLTRSSECFSSIWLSNILQALNLIEIRANKLWRIDPGSTSPLHVFSDIPSRIIIIINIMEGSIRSHPDMVIGVPSDLISALQRLEGSFAVDNPTLRKITDHFVKELEKGLSVEGGGDIPMNITWVMGFPTGQEQGRFLTLDFGGTNLRVCEVTLASDERDFEITQEKYKLPEHLRNATAEQLWDFVAECVSNFLHEHHLGGQTSAILPLAFTFSYPVVQLSIKSGVLQNWTKGFNVFGVEGHDVVPQLDAALKRKRMPVRIVALVNDTTGTLIAAAYKDPEVKIGSILSTGCNAAYMEECGSIPKIQNAGLPSDALVAVNTEYGAFDNQCLILPRTRFDERIDQLSPRPGQQIYEKMVSGMYLAELIRLIFIELHGADLLFVDQDIEALLKPNVLDSSFLSIMEEDATESLEITRNLLREKIGVDPAPHELKVCRYLAQLVGTRAARLYACGIAGICKKKRIERCHVGVDGSVFKCYANFEKRASQALRDILEWPPDSEDLITFHFSDDGSGVGAALIAALALERSDGNLLKP